MIYLDNAATTFPKPEEVYLEMDRVNRNLSVNAGRGSYKAAREASKIIEETRDRIQKLFHAEEYGDVVFAPSVTHALNQIFQGLILTADSVIYISPYEHNAVSRPLYLLQKQVGFRVELLPLDEDLCIDLEKMQYSFAMLPPTVVVINAVSNVTGYCLPYKEVFSCARKYNSINILDASQAAGLLEIKMKESASDIICFAGHKTLYGPFGIGGFCIKKDKKLKISFAGGTGSNSLDLNMPEGTPGRYEAASSNIVAIAGLNASLKTLDISKHFAVVKSLTDYLIRELLEIDKVQVLGVNEKTENIGIVSFIVDGYDADEVGVILDDEFDIAVRTGYHCAPYIHDFLKDKHTNGTVRVGIGQFTTQEDIDSLIEAIESL